MKKVLTTIILLSTAVFSFAQIPNAQFEQWSERNVPTLDDWNIAGNVTKTSDASTGFSAVRLDNNLATNTFGLVTNANISTSISGGHPYTDNPLVMTLSVKYDLAPGDVGKVLLIFTAAGNPIASIDFTVNGNSADTFEHYKVPIQWAVSTNPDTAIVAISTVDLTNATVNGDGYMIIDNLGFESVGSPNDDLPNNDFENWSNVPINYPDNWYTTDLLILDQYNLAADLNSVVRETSKPHDGSVSLLLQNRMAEGDILPGVAVTGESVAAVENPAFPVSKNWNVLHGLYKYLPDNGDTATIAVAFFSNGSLVGYGSIDFADSTDTDLYTYFSIPITFGPSVSADSATIVINSADFDNPVGENTQLWVDNLEFSDYSLSTPEIEELQVAIYPNPASTTLHLSGITGPVNIRVLDAQGRLVLSSQETTIDVSALHSGTYTLIVTSENKVQRRSFIKAE
ncbi:T9SS type A sorting domain-containing protein [bacterium]|nr:T9SS type A sorting domain-containing protein [bacterium]